MIQGGGDGGSAAKCDPNAPPVIPRTNSGSDSEMAMWRACRYRFVQRGVGDLKVGELPLLLKEYKNLAATCERLLVERNAMKAAAAGTEE